MEKDFGPASATAESGLTGDISAKPAPGVAGNEIHTLAKSIDVDFVLIGCVAGPVFVLRASRPAVVGAGQGETCIIKKRRRPLIGMGRLGKLVIRGHDEERVKLFSHLGLVSRANKRGESERYEYGQNSQYL